MVTLSYQPRLFDDMSFEVDTAAAQRARFRQRRVHVMADPDALESPGRAFWIGPNDRAVKHTDEDNAVVSLIAGGKSFAVISGQLNMSVRKVEDIALKVGDQLGLPRGKGRREEITRRYWRVKEEAAREELERLTNPVVRARRILGA